MPVRRTALLAVSVLALVAAGLAAYALMPPRQTAEVAVPADSAGAEEVVTAYLEALGAHDCGTAEALADGEFVDRARSWCRSLSSLSGVTVEPARAEEPAPYGRATGEQVVRVGVEFVMDRRPLDRDTSLEDGRMRWGYVLVRGSDDAAWRILTEGMG